MQKRAKVGLGVTAAFLVVMAGEVLWIHHKNNEVMPVAKDPYANAKEDADDLVFLRKQHPDSLKDERALIGKTIWVSAADQMDYYHSTKGHADYAHPVGTLEGAVPLVVTGVFEQVPPKGLPRAVARIAAGSGMCCSSLRCRSQMIQRRSMPCRWVTMTRGITTS